MSHIGARLLPKALKLVEALAEPCDRGEDEHAWARCRRCLAVEELSTEHGRVLMGAVRDALGDQSAPVPLIPRVTK